MELEPFVSKLEDVPEEFRKLYKEGEDGKFYLQVKSVGGYALEDVGTLKSAFEKKKREAADLKRRLEAFKDLDAEEIQAQLEELETLRAGAGKPDEKHQAQVRQLEEKHARELKTRDEKIQEQQREYGQLEQALHKELITRSATAALAEAGAMVELALPHVISRMKVEKSDDGTYDVVILEEDGVTPKITGKPGSMAKMKVDEYVIALKKDEKYQPLFAGAGKSGGGSQGGKNNGGAGDVNPWMPKTFNLTRQMEITRKDPELAKRLKAEADSAGAAA